MAKLASAVWVDGVVYGPGDDLPADVVSRISNPAAWEGGKVPASAQAPEPPADAGGEGSGEDVAGPPPKSGRGSSDQAWADYAAAKDVDVPVGAKRSEVIALLEAAGVPTE